jgi:hypothetical protein
VTDDLVGMDLARLEARRAVLYAELARVGDFRRGALNAVRRRCGKASCACAREGHPGHGPQHNLTRWAGGKTVNVRVRPGPARNWTRSSVKSLHGRGSRGWWSRSRR